MLVCFINSMVAYSNFGKILIHKYSFVSTSSTKCNSHRFRVSIIHPTSWMQMAVDEVFLPSCQIIEFVTSLHIGKKSTHTLERMWKYHLDKITIA